MAETFIWGSPIFQLQAKVVKTIKKYVLNYQRVEKGIHQKLGLVSIIGMYCVQLQNLVYVQSLS